MSISVVVILEMIVIFTMIAVGFILRRSGHLGDSTVQSVSYLITYILNPCLNISIAISYEGKLPEDRFARAFIWCAILYAVLIGMSYFFPIALRIPRNEKFTYKMLTVYGNTGFIGLPICRAVFGTESLVYVTINNILFTFLIYTYGSAILRRTKRLQDGKAAEKPSFAKTLKSIFNVGTISGIIAIVIYLTDPPLPTFIGEIFSYIGEPTIFLSLMILGSSVASKPLKTLLSTAANDRASHRDCSYHEVFHQRPTDAWNTGRAYFTARRQYAAHPLAGDGIGMRRAFAGHHSFHDHMYFHHPGRHAGAVSKFRICVAVSPLLFHAGRAVSPCRCRCVR